MPYYLMTTEELEEFELEYDREHQQIADAIINDEGRACEYNTWQNFLLFGRFSYGTGH